MAFAIYFCLTVIIAVSFVATKRHLHLFEVLFLWMVINILHHNLLTVTALNLEMFNYSGYPANYWTLVWIRVFLTPLIIIWYFDRTLPLKVWKKWAWLPVTVAILIGIEYLAAKLNVYTRWNWWWSDIGWMGILLLVYFAWFWFRKLLRKEMN